MRIWKLWLPIVSAASLAAGVWFVVFHTDGFVARPALSTLTVTIDTITNDGGPQLAKVLGHTNQPCSVTLNLNGFEYARQKTTGTSFQFDHVIVRPGENGIVVTATLPALQQSSAQAEKHAFVRAPPALVDPDSDDEFTLDAAGSIPVPLQRTVTAEFSYRRLELNISAELPADDRRVEIINNGALQIPQGERAPLFVKEVFNEFLIGDWNIAAWCKDITFHPALVNRKVTITGTCITGSKPLFANSFDQNFAIETDWRSLGNEDDQIILDGKDYALKLPTLNDDASLLQTLKDNRAIITRSPNRGPVQSSFSVPLEYDPFSIRNITTTLHSSLDDLLPDDLSAVVLFLSGLLFGIPLAWLLATLAKYPHLKSIAPPATTTLVRVIPWLSAALFVPFVLYLLNNLASLDLTKELLTILLRKSVDFRTEDLRVLVKITAGIAIIAFLVSAVLRVFLQRPLSVWFETVFRGIGLAAASALAVMILSASSLKLWPSLTLSAVLPTGVILLTLILLLLLFRKLLCVLGAAGSLLNVFGVISVALLFFAAEDAPLSLIRPPHSTGLQHMHVLSDVLVAFESIRSLVPYAILFGLLILLKHIDEMGTDDDRADKFAKALGVILLAAFIIPPGSEWLMLPLPMLLGIWLFRRYLMLPIEKQLSLGRHRASVVTQRPSWASRVLMAIERVSLRENLKKLESQRAILTPEEYERRKGATATSIAEIEANLTFEEGFTLDEVLLGIGPYSSNWDNGRWAVKRALILIAPLLLIHVYQYAATPVQQYRILGVVVVVLGTFCYWLTAAFFFGFFFTDIRGQSGLRKGLWLALLIIICLTVSDLELTRQLQSAIEVLYLLVALGCQFDYRNFRDSMGAEFQWTRLVQVETGWAPKITGAAILSYVLVTTGTMVFKDGMGALLKAAYRHMFG